MNAYLVGCTVLGANWGAPALIEDPNWGVPVLVHGEIVGMFDMNTVTQQMNTLGNSNTVGVAQSLLSGALTVINQAIQEGTAQNLPGGTDRNNVLAHLQWHQNKLSTFGANVNAMYDSFADLKKYASEAFIESNAVEEGANWINSAWDAMWTEIATRLAALPKQVRQAVESAANTAVEDTTGLPIWAWLLIGAGGVGLVGFGIYKLANTQAAAAVAGGITHAYMR